MPAMPKERGAQIMAQHKGNAGAGVTATIGDCRWKAARARPLSRRGALVNAGGPWVEDVIREKIHVEATEGVRLGPRLAYRDQAAV